jgi:hypothetical protein
VRSGQPHNIVAQPASEHGDVGHRDALVLFFGGVAELLGVGTRIITVQDLSRERQVREIPHERERFELRRRKVMDKHGKSLGVILVPLLIIYGLVLVGAPRAGAADDPPAPPTSARQPVVLSVNPAPGQYVEVARGLCETQAQRL